MASLGVKPAIAEILREIEVRAPLGTAEYWDNVGLLVGDPKWRTSQVVVSIDLTADSLAAARSKGARLIVTHHPCMFPKSKGSSAGRLVSGGEEELSTLIIEALRSRIAIAACHTNFDRCALEVVEAVSSGLGVEPQGRLLETAKGSLKKLVVFVPRPHAEAVRRAVCDAGAGRIGLYDQCTFSAPGEGTFRGSAGTRPFLGEPGSLERAEELRLETIFPSGLEKQVLRALFEVHPYEEVAFDLYAVEQGVGCTGINRGLGYGFWGDFPTSRPFSDLAKDVTRLFDLDGFWITDPLPKSVGRRVKRIAFAAGKGAAFVDAAHQAGCDVFVTGEAGYHQILDAKRKGMAVMELGHRESEFFFVRTMRSWLNELGLNAVGVNSPTQRIWTNTGRPSK